ncbi:beta-propeller domain-containing protein [Porphyrobacter sp. YT40]|uniref:beta-propeller domain-containing protein n=1 Tax=Porphyrobacter sp. YT40 TaxID=2547601 RepID=UPI0011440E18|nr:beta-propeller domain-containing protein [Porphyrobacter sp. YT40]QDH34671.1 hypothetical protein E2E27_10255 [Porphyrobacter sp. YT40]
MITEAPRAGQAVSIGVVLAIVALLIAAVGLSAPSDAKAGAAAAGSGLEGFADRTALDAFTRKMARLERQQATVENLVLSAPPAIDPVVADAAEPPPPGSESITNTQEAGVDEGGIVKQAGDYLVVLRRGRLFTIRIGGDTLAPAGMIDAFPPGKNDPDDTWYDEMLIHDRQVIVIGYSYGSAGTEINRFDIGEGGKLAYRDTHYLHSGDYYSSSNYASRLIGDELVFYTPVPAYWSDLDDNLPVIRKGRPDARPVPLVRPRDFLVAEPYRKGGYPLDTLHTVTRCTLGATLDCRARAIAGTWSHAFYVSRDAVYVWTGVAEDTSRGETRGVPGQLYRIPLAGGTPGAVQVSGSPVDQFSFAEDAEGGVLRVLLRGEGSGEGMWDSEVSGGSVALASVPLARFGNGAGRLALADYRTLPAPEGWRFHNRFVGNYVLYAAGDYGREEETGTVYAVPLGGGAVQEIAIPHGVTRFDRMGSDAIAIGPARGDGLGFSALSLGGTPRLEDVYILAAAGEGETRSQAFFFRPDPGSSDGTSGVLGLPISRREARGDGGEFLGAGSAIAFMRRAARKLAPIGELAAAPGVSRSDNCKASCVDWYGNARPIFTGGRVFALMGYELVEGTLSGGAITERRRASFAP